MAGGLTRGEVRLVKFTTPDKVRPALVLTRSTALAYLSTATVAPITSTIRGIPSEVLLGVDDGMKDQCAVNLHNLMTIDQDRIGRRVSQLDDSKMREVCAALGFALGCA